MSNVKFNPDDGSGLLVSRLQSRSNKVKPEKKKWIYLVIIGVGLLGVLIVYLNITTTPSQTTKVGKTIIADQADNQPIVTASKSSTTVSSRKSSTQTDRKHMTDHSQILTTHKDQKSPTKSKILPSDNQPTTSWSKPSTQANAYPTWDPTHPYQTGDRVTYNGSTYEAKWWSLDFEPDKKVVNDADTPWQKFN